MSSKVKSAATTQRPETWIEVIEPKSGRHCFTEKAHPPWDSPGKMFFGAMGVLFYDESLTEIMCSVCGEFHSQLGHHVRRHGLTSLQYKVKFGLPRHGGLTGRDVKASNIARARASAVGIAHGAATGRGRGSHASKNMAFMNKRGLCPTQLLEKLRVLVTTLGGRVPSQHQLQRAGIGVLGHRESLRRWEEYVKMLKKLGLEPHPLGYRTKHLRRSLKTHCIHGHSMSGDNLIVSPDGLRRRCRTCTQGQWKRTRDQRRD